MTLRAPKLTVSQIATLTEMAGYNDYYPFRHATSKTLVALGLASVVPNDKRKRPAHRITPAGRAALNPAGD